VIAPVQRFRLHRDPSLAGQFDLQLNSTAVRGLVVAFDQTAAFSSWMRTFRVVASMRRPSKGPASGRPEGVSASVVIGR
jgi:hypothetical protein